MITQKLLKTVFKYKKGSLYWNKKVKTINPKFPPKLIGAKAGCINPTTGYSNVRIFGKNYKEHRLIYLFHHGSLPDLPITIDHKDNNRANNDIHNLREADRTQQSLNTKTPITNTSGVKGVYKTPYNTYTAHIRHNKEKLHLGTFKTLEEAEQVVRAKREELHGEFCRHE